MASSVRQSVTVPADLARQIQRDAKRKHQTFSKTLLDYARVGLVERDRRFKQLHEVVEKIQSAATAEDAAQFDEELEEAIFGPQERSSKGA
jgi:hypothetical protein